MLGRAGGLTVLQAKGDRYSVLHGDKLRFGTVDTIISYSTVQAQVCAEQKQLLITPATESDVSLLAACESGNDRLALVVVCISIAGSSKPAGSFCLLLPPKLHLTIASRL